MYTKTNAATLMIVMFAFVLFFIAAGCSEDATAPPIKEKPAAADKRFTLDRHALALYRVVTFTGGETYASSAYLGIVKLSAGRTTSAHHTLVSLYYDMWASSPSDIFAVGLSSLAMEGSILHYDGRDWTEMTHPLESLITGMFGTSGSDVYAVSGDEVAHYDGTSWSKYYEVSAELYDGWSSGSDDVFLFGDHGLILHNDGTDWTDQTLVNDVMLWSSWGSGPNDVFVIGGDSTVYHYNGSVWGVSYNSPAQLTDIDGVGPSEVYAVGEDGLIVQYNGTTWTPLVSTGTSESLNGVSVTSETNGVAVGNNGVVLRLTGGGWQLEHEAADLTWMGVAGTSANDVFAVAAEGSLATFDGTGWDLTGTPAGFMPVGVWCTAPNKVWVTGATGTPTPGAIYSFDRAAWTLEYATSETAASLWGTGDDNIWAVGGDGFVTH